MPALTVNGLTVRSASSASAPRLDAAGTDRFEVGGTIDLPPDLPAAHYRASFHGDRQLRLRIRQTIAEKTFPVWTVGFYKRHADAAPVPDPEIYHSAENPCAKNVQHNSILAHERASRYRWPARSS